MHQYFSLVIAGNEIACSDRPVAIAHAKQAFPSGIWAEDNLGHFSVYESMEMLKARIACASGRWAYADILDIRVLNAA